MTLEEQIFRVIDSFDKHDIYSTEDKESALKSLLELLKEEVAKGFDAGTKWAWDDEGIFDEGAPNKEEYLKQLK